jgi:hypothetical protein
MSGRTRSVAVIRREYIPSTEHCARALELLLKKAGPATRPDDPERRSHEIRAESRIPR